MKLYHGSNDENLEYKKRFLWGTRGCSTNGGLFFSESEETALSFGDYLYEIEIDEDNILERFYNSLFNSFEDEEFGEVYNKIKEITLKYVGVNKEEIDDETLEEIADASLKDINTFDLSDDALKFFGIEIVNGKVNVKNGEEEKFWAIQDLRGVIAKEFNLCAAEMSDETGTSYLVVNQEILKDMKRI